MKLGLSDEQEQLVASFAQLFAKESSSEAVREAEPLGFAPDLWATVQETGAVAMAVPEAAGGWGATMLDLALVAEEVGRASAAAPVIDTQVAARLLAAVSAPAEVVDAIVNGERLVTLALHAPVGGVARLVPAGAVCDSVVVLDGERLLLVDVDDAARTSVRNLADAPLADVAVDGGTVVAEGPSAVAAFEAAIDEWLTLTASALVGLGTASHVIACEYATERAAFGRIIGTFQGVAHPLADDATALDGARLLARKAAWAHDVDDARARELSAMAFAFAARTAEQATYDAIHTHGGYGFMLEYDVQLHYRRCRGWSRVWGDAERAVTRAADARYAAATEGGN